MTFIHFFSVWEKEMIEDFHCLTFRANFHYENFVHAWYAFLNLLDIDASEGFRCETCGDCPPTVVCDGTSLGFRRQLLQTLVSSKVQPQQVAIRRFRYVGVCSVS